MPKYHIPGFNRGEVSPIFGSKPSSEEHVFGVKKAENVMLRGDGSLERRAGTTVITEIISSSNAHRVFHYDDNDDHFAFVLTSNDSLSERRIYLFQLVSGTWSSVTVQYALQESYAPYLVFSPTATTFYPHYYLESEMADVQYVQYQDMAVFLHEDYPPILISKSTHPTTGYNFWTFDPFPFRDGGGEIFSSRPALSFTSSEIVTDQDLGPALLELNSTVPIFTRDYEPFDVMPTYAVETTVYKPGAIVRFGDFIQNPNPGNISGPQGDKIWGYGAFWNIQQVRSNVKAKVTRITNDSPNPLSIKVDDPGLWAGPWNYEGTTGTGFGSSVLPASVPGDTFTITDGQNSLKRSDVGRIIYTNRVGTNTGSFFFILSGNGTNLTLLNIGPRSWPAATASNTLYFFEPQANHDNNEVSMVIIDRADPTPATDTLLFFKQQDPLPVNHELAYQDHDLQGTTVGVGGPVYVGGGIARVYTKETVPGGEANFTAYKARWDRHPISAGPIAPWGYGPSKGSGFPDVGEVHQRRLCFAGFKRPGTALVASATERPWSLNALDEAGIADAPINISFGEEGERIRWMKSFTDLVVGTSQKEFVLKGNPLTSNSLGVDLISSYGGAHVVPVVVGPVVLFVGSGGRSIRELKRDFDTDGFLAQDLMVRASHLLAKSDPGHTGIIPAVAEETITRISAIHHPETQVAVLTSKNQLFFLSHNDDEGIKGFTRHTLTDPDTNSNEDLVLDIIRSHMNVADGIGDTFMILAQHWIGASQAQKRLHLEIFSPSSMNDCEVVALSPGLTQASGFTRLANRIVDVRIDGKWAGQFTVSVTGSIDYSSLNLSVTPNKVIAGFPYTGTIDLHVPILADGRGNTTAGHIVQPRRVILFLHDSFDGSVAGREALPMTLAPAALPQSFTGWRSVPASGASPSTFPTIEIRAPKPFRFKLGSVVIDASTES